MPTPLRAAAIVPATCVPWEDVVGLQAASEVSTTPPMHVGAEVLARPGPRGRGGWRRCRCRGHRRRRTGHPSSRPAPARPGSGACPTAGSRAVRRSGRRSRWWCRERWSCPRRGRCPGPGSRPRTALRHRGRRRRTRWTSSGPPAPRSGRSWRRRDRPRRPRGPAPSRCSSPGAPGRGRWCRVRWRPMRSPCRRRRWRRRAATAAAVASRRVGDGRITWLSHSVGVQHPVREGRCRQRRRPGRRTATGGRSESGARAVRE